MHAQTEQPLARPFAPPDEELDVLQWTVHPAINQPRKTAAAVLLVGVTWIAALEVFTMPLVALACCLALLGSIAEWLFPTHHRITPEGVFTRCAWQLRNIGWDRVRSITRGAHGAHISPFHAKSRLSRVRGVTIRFGEENEREIVAAIRRYYPVEAAAKPSAGKDAS
jgi:hypothetical protein